MCGIVGIYHDNLPDFVEYAIHEMLHSLVHRGPDSEGIILANPIALGVRRLSIIDRRGADQPLKNENGNIYLVFNGEIYNFHALRKILIHKGHSFYTQGDGEVIIHAYEEFGEECVSILEGMFAFALWDSRTHTLLIARDRFGEKPLFYAHTDDVFVFASELKALLRYPNIRREPNYAALSFYLYLSYIPAPLTAYVDVFKLLPGHLLLWHNGQLTCRQYWQPELTPKVEHGFEQAVLEVGRKLKESVDMRLESEVPIGVFLSGGIDSSLVSAFAQQRCDTPLETFSIGFENEPEYDEGIYASAVSSYLGTNHHHMMFGIRAVEEIEKVLSIYGEPFADASVVPTYYLAQFAREYVGVVITGDGGDEIFGGYSRYVSVLDSHDPMVLNAKIKTILDAKSRHEILSQACWSVNPDRILANESLESLVTGKNDYSILDRAMLLDFRTYLPDSVLYKVDTATMAHSLEARCPFLDSELAEYTMKLPDSHKVSGKQTKTVLRSVGRTLLPASITSRSKRGFSVPIRTWMNQTLKPCVFDLLCDHSVRQRGFLSGPKLNALIYDHYDGMCDNSRQLWALLVLEMWFRRSFPAS